MPQIKYTLSENGECFSEIDYIISTQRPELFVIDEIMSKLNERRATLGEPILSLVRVVVINPHIHLHAWRRGAVDKYGLVVPYTCDRCGITGYRRYHLANGEFGHEVIRHRPYDKKKYELCRDPLRKISGKMTFKFG